MTEVGDEALDLLTVDEVAAHLRLSSKTVRRLIAAERKRPGAGLEAVKIGSSLRVPPEAVIEYKKRLRAASRPAPVDDVAGAA
jgi:excisionase family DNA binding protein